MKNEFIDLFEMANVKQHETGLPMIIFVSPNNARIKVQTNHSHKTRDDLFVSVSIDKDNPEIVAGEGLSNKDFDLVQKYIKLNYNLLMSLWLDKISSTEFVNQSKRIDE